jgi:DNA-binding transcriptional ArsR family regulator
MIVELTELIDAGRTAGHSSERIAEEIATVIRDPKHAKGCSHPIRAQVLHRLALGPASPKVLSDELGVPLGNVSYHVRHLRDLGLIELASTRPRRGAVEHTYRLAENA